MMKRLILTFMAVCMSLVAAAQPAKEDIIKEIVETGSSMKSLQCSFIQTRKMSIMSTEAVSEGRMHYQQPDKLRWEYVVPYKNVFVLNGTEALMQNETRSDVVDIEQNRRFKGIARLMTGSIRTSAYSVCYDRRNRCEIISEDLQHLHTVCSDRLRPGADERHARDE